MARLINRPLRPGGVLALLVAHSLIASTPIDGQVFVPIRGRVKQPTLAGGIAGTEAECKVCLQAFPASNATEAAELFSRGSRWDFLSYASVSGGKDTGAAGVEIVADYLGFARIGLATVVAAGSDSLRDAQRFLSGGGSAVLHAQIAGPTVSWSKGTGYAMTVFAPKVGFDMPVLGSETSGSSVNSDVGAELRLVAPLSLGKLVFLGTARTGWVKSGREFRTRLDLSPTDGSSFWYSRVAIGFGIPVLNSALLLHFIPSGPKALRSLAGGGRIALQVSPGG